MDHTDSEHSLHVEPLENKREYYKFAAVIFGIVLVSILLTTWREGGLRLLLEDFMAVFFITFAAFKFVNIELFAQTYKTYDLVTQKFPAWGYLFPFVEAALGFAYLLSTKNTTLNLLTMLITGVAGYSVWRELQLSKTRRRGHFMCACLGNVIRLPLSKVSFMEDAAMFVMAAIMLFIK
jgi:hypothetical protein